jgi:hypothetical protein
MTPGSALKRARQNASLNTTALRASRSSSALNVRPAIAGMPSTSKNPAVTHWRATLSALLPTPLITMAPTPPAWPAKPSKARVRWFQSARFSGDTGVRDDGVCSHAFTSRSGSPSASGRSRAASTRANIAPLAPIPSASVSAATPVKAGALLSCRAANVASCRKSSNHCARRISPPLSAGASARGIPVGAVRRDADAWELAACGTCPERAVSACGKGGVRGRTARHIGGRHQR